MFIYSVHKMSSLQDIHVSLTVYFGILVGGVFKSKKSK